MEIKKLYLSDYIGKQVSVNGWVRNHRRQAHFGFIDLFDGTCFKTIQVVYEDSLNNFNDISKILVGSSINVKGIVVESQGKQAFELKATEITLLASSKSSSFAR